MRVFVSVVDAGSLTAAAAASDMSATMVGNHVQALESRLGTRLLNRTTRRQHLTEFGKVYYDRCIEILGLVADADALAMQTHAVPKGRLRITAPVSFGDRLMPALCEYAALYPAVELDISLSDAVTDLVEDDFEAALRIGPLQDSALIARPLAPYRMIVCASPAYLSRRGKPRTPQDLSEHECLAFSFSPKSEWRSARPEWPLTGPEGTLRVPIGGRIRADNSQGLRRAALSGMGIAMLPEVLVAEDLAARTLVRILPGHEPTPRPFNLVYLRDRRMTPKLTSFIAFIVERFAPTEKSRRGG